MSIPGGTGDRRDVEILAEKAKEEESQKRKQEAEIMKLRMDQAYELALEERRRQLEDQEKQMVKDAEDASLHHENRMSQGRNVSARIRKPASASS